MGTFSIWHILILGAAALLLFGGRGKISDFMGDFGKGIRSFKKGLIEGDDEDAPRVSASKNRPVDDLPLSPLTTSVPTQAVKS